MRLLKNGEKGFTLIELLIVVAILGVLAAVVIPNVGQFIGRGKTEASSTEVATVQSAVTNMMVDNGLNQLPDFVTSATLDMSEFPSPNADNATNYVLYGYTGNATINYIQTQLTKNTYTVDAAGTITKDVDGY